MKVIKVVKIDKLTSLKELCHGAKPRFDTLGTSRVK